MSQAKCPGCGNINSMIHVDLNTFQCKLCGHTVRREQPLAVLNALSRAMVPAAPAPAVQAPAPEPRQDAGSFTFSIANGHVTITKYTGTAMDVDIPARLQGLPVCCIGPSAFADTHISSVSLPDSVQYVDERAFQNCQQLIYFRGGRSLLRLGEEAFQNCCSLTRLELLGDTDVQYSTFAGCYSLGLEPEHVIWPDKSMSDQ